MNTSHCHSDDNSQYLLGADEQILQAISAGALLPDVLNKICDALGCQIANVVSLISLPWHDVSDLVAIAKNAALCGLYTFCSEALVSENDELLGSLEMYCCDRRGPSPSELQLIERAKHLAALAIKREIEKNRRVHCGVLENPPVRGNMDAGPVHVN